MNLNHVAVIVLLAALVGCGARQHRGAAKQDPVLAECDGSYASLNNPQLDREAYRDTCPELSPTARRCLNPQVTSTSETLEPCAKAFEDAFRTLGPEKMHRLGFARDELSP